LKESSVQAELMKDFPPIYKERNPEVLAELIAAFVKESGGIILDDETPDVPDDAPLRVRGKRAKSDDGSEAAGVQTKKAKKDKFEATNPVSIPASAPKRKRGKGESSIIKKAAKSANEFDWDAKSEAPKAKEVQLTGNEILSSQFEVTLEMAKEADKIAAQLKEEQKKKKVEYLAAREAKLKSLGVDSSNEFLIQKTVEVQEIAAEVQQKAVKEAKKIQGTSEVDALEAAPKTAKVAEASEASAKVIQTSDLPSTIPTPLSPSKPSPKPYESNYSTILKSIGEMSQRRVEICNQLPADHPFQPPTIEPLNMILPNNPQPSQPTNQTPLQEEQTSAAAECSEDPEEPKTSDLPKCDSPSNLFSLEKHLGGELQETPQKATTSASEKTDVVNQQQPKPIQQTTPEPTQSSTQTQTSTPTQTSTKQQIIPEFVVASVAKESVQVTESETAVSITNPSPTKNLPLTTNDQPSSSSSPSIQTPTKQPPNLLKSEFPEAEMLQISNELQRLVKLRRSPTLKIAYEDQWETLKTRASELLNSVNQRCLNIQATAYMHRFSSVLSVEEDQAPLLFLANAPYFPESDYMTREAMMFKLLKQKVLKQQEEAKAREDLLRQKQAELEEALKKQAALIEQLMNKQPNP